MKIKTVSKWSDNDKFLYFFTVLLTWVLLTIISIIYSYKYSIFALIGYILLYFILVFFQAKDWCIGCPYRGKFCPGILCMGLANIMSTWFFKNKKFKYSKKKEHIVSILTGIYFVYPVFFFYNNIFILVSYALLLIIHLMLQWKFFCPRCKFNKICPGGKVSTKIFKK
ncbi:hypothetical protein GOV04_00355 [Candidatus Woesearchaeota archaeon]|nr:hypothetical protein [Candidatus Woesearchaeota archaeon]